MPDPANLPPVDLTEYGGLRNIPEMLRGMGVQYRMSNPTAGQIPIHYNAARGVPSAYSQYAVNQARQMEQGVNPQQLAGLLALLKTIAPGLLMGGAAAAPMLPLGGSTDPNIAAWRAGQGRQGMPQFQPKTFLEPGETMPGGPARGY